MKKDKLIELLQSIKGNPEIVIWNGFVCDYQPISNKITEMFLYKETKQSQLKMINYERLRDGLEPITINDFKDKSNYELRYYVKSSYCKKKKVAILETKRRRITTYDRNGKINY